MIYLCHLLVFILPGGCCQHRGLLFTMWQLHLKRKDSPCKNSASKQIRPEPLKRSGCVQDPFSLHVKQMMQQHAEICITSVLMPLSGNPMYEPKNRVRIQIYCIMHLLSLFIYSTLKLNMIFLIDYLYCFFFCRVCIYPSSLWKSSTLLVYIPLPLLCSPNLQATGRSCTLNKNCHPGQLAAMKHLFCLTFPGT